MACAICEIRRAKRHCPARNGEICAICCGEQREETIDCPYDCQYLYQAHHHENLEKDTPPPNAAFPIPEGFLEQNVPLIMAFQQAIVQESVDHRAIDNDVAEALDGLFRTYKTMESGLYYDSRPANPLAAAIFDAIQRRVEEIRRIEAERGHHKLKDHQILTVIVFLQQLEFAFNNGRKKGRSFIHNTLESLGEMQESLEEPSARQSLIIS